MRILYAVPFWANMCTVYLFREIAAMRDRGHEVAVLSMKVHEDGWSNVEAFGISDIPVFQVQRQFKSDLGLLGDVLKLSGGGLFLKPEQSLRANVRRAGLRHGVHDWTWNKRVLAFVKSFNPDVIDAFWASEAAALARSIHDSTDIPYTVTLLGGDVYRSPTPGLPHILEKAAGVFPLSIYLQRLLLGELKPDGLPSVPEVSIDPQRIRLRPLTLPKEYIANQPVPQDSPTVTIATIARLAPEKRLQDLIQAMAVLAPEFKNLRLQLIGDGPLKDELVQLSEELKVDDRVEFAGLKTTPQIREMLHEANIYCQPSEVEGFCLAALEGASQGMPAVATKTGAHESIVQEGKTGFLFDAGDVDTLVLRLRELASDPELRLRMGTDAISHVEREFEFEGYIAKMELMLNAVVAGNPLP